MEKISASATTVFWPPESCSILSVSSPPPNLTLQLTPEYFFIARTLGLFFPPAVTSSPGSSTSDLIITSSPEPPGTSSVKARTNSRATPLNVRSSSSSFCMSRALISSLILPSSFPCSWNLFVYSSRCSAKLTYWSRAFLFTWLNLCSSFCTFSCCLSRLLLLLSENLPNASLGREPRSLILFSRSCRLCTSVCFLLRSFSSSVAWSSAVWSSDSSRVLHFSTTFSKSSSLDWAVSADFSIFSTWL
mmetsp:Transcript_13270/g.33305  ORF Transcript_13270/g.33305 Transcript_13270/m.33305 type:complete len:246 (-) Transcript_13270:351-1088(-)